MCGRFTLRASPVELAEYFNLFPVPDVLPRPNIAPTQTVLGIVLDSESTDFVARNFRWGLVPSWADDPRIGARMINARGETVATKPAFRSAFKRRRCLIPADGFYEWKPIAPRKKKQPVFIGLKGERLFAFAGLWEIWQGSDGVEIASCTIITTNANPLVATVHDRMPVILSPDDCAAWLDPAANPEELQRLLVPFPPEEMELSEQLAEQLLSPPAAPGSQQLF